MIEQFKQLPRAMQVLMGVLAAAAAFALAALLDPRAVIVLLIGIVVIILAMLLWFWRERRKARQRAQALMGEISDNSGAAPNAISSPAARAKLDDLRRNFQAGVDKFRAAGKDLYSLPWFVVCGEPGSGKSEAVRHCGVGFPPGLQDEMQGAGGTLNMHWWFTNHAVLLDTAGKLLFQEAPAGTTTEWTEFLGLLKKSRPNCPINGLLLVIPSDSLIKDSLADVQKKAAKIVRQLDQIQRILDVRFPVFVLVTKCDLINGFREFFSGIKDPQLQHQMTGWSNPDPLDTPFQPEAVDQHLETVVKRISRRRLGLLKDPIATDGSARRIDEVDSLFSLPASIAALSPRLRKYLETIFVAGEWSSKPLFLRGIYFTSALTEGAALDQEIAETLGLPVDSLPEGKAWVRERSFFLRDLFLQKIFKERGLVTRASNTRRQRRRRHLILTSVVVSGLLVLLGFSWFGASALRRSIGAERDLWAAAAGGWTDKYWRPIVKPLFQGSLKYGYTGAEPVEVGDAKLPLAELHQELQRMAAKPVQVPWVFKPVEALVMGADAKRREAQRVLYEAGVVLPLLDAARLRLARSGESWMPGGERQLALLVQLEGLIHLRGVEGYVNDLSAEDFLGPLLTPWLGGAPLPDPLLRVFDATYRRGGDTTRAWPGAWISAGGTLRENRPIDTGWGSFAKALEDEQAARLAGLELVREGRLAAGAFLNAERAFQQAALAPRGAAWAEELARRFTALGERQAALEALIKQAGATAHFGSAGFSLAGGYAALVEASRRQGAAATEPLAAVLDQQKAAADKAETMSGPKAEFTLFRDVRRRLGETSRKLAGVTERAFSASEQAELAALDASIFQPGEDPAQRRFNYRHQVYRDVLTLLNPVSSENPAAIGRLAEIVAQIGTRQEALRQRIDKYSGGGRDEFQAAARQLLAGAADGGMDQIAEVYAAEVGREIDRQLGYPLVRTGPDLSPEQVKSVQALTAKVRSDVSAPGLSANAKKRVAEAAGRALQIGEFATALTSGPEGTPPKFRLLLPPEGDQRKALAAAGAGAGAASGFAGRVYRTVRIGDKVVKPIWEKGDASPWLAGVVSDRLPVLEFFEGPDPRNTADARHNFGGEWGVLRALEAGAQRHLDGKKWDLVLTLRDAQGESRLQLTVELDVPLPPVAQWPR